MSHTMTAGVVVQLRRMAAGEHLAEYLVDVTTKADRQGNGAIFADVYSKSALKRDNDRAVHMHIEQDIAVAACLPGKKVREIVHLSMA